MGQSSCDVDGCGRKPLARGWCSAHWQRWKKTGDPGGADIAHQHTRCQVNGCGSPNYGNGYCGPHWRRWKKYGNPTATPVRGQRGGCSVDGCADPHSARGYCASHYARWRRTGDAGTAFTVRRRDPAARDEQGRKQCRGCDEWLREQAFHRHATTSDKLTPECKGCHWVNFTVRQYGVSPTWYAETLAIQGGVCAICGDAPAGRRMHIDHDHAHCPDGRGCSECVRGLLCSPCNTGLGMFRERPDLMRSAIEYLGRHGG